jgi:hypothetical protein
MWRIIKCTIALIGILMLGTSARAQQVAVKSNLLADAVLSPNLGVEVGIAPRWTIDLSGQLNLWSLSHERRWEHWLVQPEARYWFCERFNRHFVAAHLLGGEYNIGHLHNSWNFLGTDFSKLSDYRYRGWFVGAGVGYGYSWILGRHWNLEGEIGVGYTYSRSDEYRCHGCSQKERDDVSHHYVGPTKAAVNLVYTF